MIQVLSNRDELIYGYIEYQIVDNEGQFKEGGEYIYVQDLWIHPKARGKALKMLIRKVNKDPFTQNCTKVYWNNLKQDRLTRSYNRQRLSKLGE